MKKEQVNTRLPDPLLSEIDKRRAILGETRGGYLTLIAQAWVAQGCPPVSEYEAQLLLKIKSRVRPPDKNLNVWKLEPEKVYLLEGDELVMKLMTQLGVPNLFARASEYDKTHQFVAFDNHPTHWIVIGFWKGHESASGNGLLFEAVPKAGTTREKMLDDLTSRALRHESKDVVTFSQIPERVAAKAAH